jgi:hypothetical protein
MPKKSLVIAYHNGAVNFYLDFVHTARHISEMYLRKKNLCININFQGESN